MFVRWAYQDGAVRRQERFMLMHEEVMRQAREQGISGELFRDLVNVQQEDAGSGGGAKIKSSRGTFRLAPKGSPQRGAHDFQAEEFDVAPCRRPDRPLQEPRLLGEQEGEGSETGDQVQVAAFASRASTERHENGDSSYIDADDPDEDPRSAPAGEDSIPGRESDAGRQLIRRLRESAVQFEKTGVNPDLLDSLGAAVKSGFSAGLEKEQKGRELRDFGADASGNSFAELLEENRATAENFRKLVRSLVVQNRVAEAFCLHDDIKKHGFEFDAEMYVSLILSVLERDGLCDVPGLESVHVKCGELEVAEAFLQKMEEEWPSCGPNLIHHTILINGHVERGNCRRAWELFQNLRTWHNLQPDEVLFTTMIKACGVNDEAERALNILEDLRSAGSDTKGEVVLYPTDVTYQELIRVMASRPDFATKAFEFKNHLEAEDLPVTAEVYEDLLRAASHLENGKVRASGLLVEMRERQVSLTANGYAHLVRFAPVLLTANRWKAGGTRAALTHRTEARLVPLRERVLNLRQAWCVVQHARRSIDAATGRPVEIDAGILNAVLEMYVCGNFDGYAVEMLQQFASFGVSPDFGTYRCLLEMCHVKQDVGRFFSLWDLALDSGVCKELLRRKIMINTAEEAEEQELTCSAASAHVPEIVREQVATLYNLALENSIRTQSSKRCCQVLAQMHEMHVFPSHELASKLARVGRHVLEIHQWVQKFLELNKGVVLQKVERDQVLLDAELEEYKLRQAREGRRAGQATAAQSARRDNFQFLEKRGLASKRGKPRNLPKGEYIKRKKFGGQYYAERVDRGTPKAELPQ
eukprot:g11539.t1